jgi:lauroyl/myristoyl acyltransferase
VALGFALGLLRWLRATSRARSRRAINAIAARGPGRDALALAHLAHTAARDQLIQRPWMVTGIPVDGVAHLRMARSHGRGVLVSYCHLGPFPGIGVTVKEYVENVHQVAGGWLAAPRPEFTTTRVKQWRAIFDNAGVPLIAAEGCFPVVTELLRGGAVVVMAFDWPGSAETCFLGKPVWLASGSAKLAKSTGAIVVPAMRYFDRLQVRTRFGVPIDPRHHADWCGVHAELAARHERWILQQPAALEDPRREGAWGAAATAESWGNPASAA